MGCGEDGGAGGGVISSSSIGIEHSSHSSPAVSVGEVWGE